MITLTLGDRHFYTGYSDRVGYIYQEFKRPGKDGRMSKIKCLYIGCSSYSEAKKISSNFDRHRTIVRQAERAIDWEWEVKVQGDYTIAQVDAIATQAENILDSDRGSGRNVMRFPVDGDRKLENQATGLRRHYSKEDWRKRSLFC